MTALPHHQLHVLRVIVSAPDGVTAKEIAAKAFGEGWPARSGSASVSGTALELIRKGLAIRTLRKRELYAYYATDAGREAVKGISI